MCQCFWLRQQNSFGRAPAKVFPPELRQASDFRAGLRTLLFDQAEGRSHCERLLCQDTTFPAPDMAHSGPTR